MWPIIDNALEHNGLITAFAVAVAIMWLSVVLSKYLTFGRVHGSAILAQSRCCWAQCCRSLSARR